MKEKLQTALGVFGLILYYAISLFLFTLPFMMIDLRWWIEAILIFFLLIFPSFSGIFWIWGLVAAISGPQDVFTIIYYIVFAIFFIPYFLSIIGNIIRKFKG